MNKSQWDCVTYVETVMLQGLKSMKCRSEGLQNRLSK